MQIILGMYVGVGLYCATNSLYVAISEDEWKKCVWRQVSCSFDAVIKIQMPLIRILKTFCSFLKLWHGLILKIFPFFFVFAVMMKLIYRSETPVHHKACVLLLYRSFLYWSQCDHEVISDVCGLQLFSHSGMFHTQQKPEESLNEYLFNGNYEHKAKLCE